MTSIVTIKTILDRHYDDGHCVCFRHGYCMALLNDLAELFKDDGAAYKADAQPAIPVPSEDPSIPGPRLSSKAGKTVEHVLEASKSTEDIVVIRCCCGWVGTFKRTLDKNEEVEIQKLLMEHAREIR